MKTNDNRHDQRWSRLLFLRLISLYSDVFGNDTLHICDVVRYIITPLALQRQLVLLKAQYDACGREKFTLYEQYREAKITAEEYLSGKDELTRKQAALKEQLEESEALYEANQQMGDAASEQQEAVGKMTGLSDAKLREHLYDAVERVLVYDSESIEIVWKFNEVKNGSSSYAGAGV